MKKLLVLSGTCAVALAVTMLNPLEVSAQTKSKPKKSEFDTKVAPVIQKFCVSCHSGDYPADGKLIKSPVTEADAKKNTKLWKKMAHEMEEKKMPPKDTAQPTEAQRKAVLAWIKKNIK